MRLAAICGCEVSAAHDALVRAEDTRQVLASGLERRMRVRMAMVEDYDLKAENSEKKSIDDEM
jgi:hypothetical protein